MDFCHDLLSCSCPLSRRWAPVSCPTLLLWGRRECPFAEKAVHAQEAGAIAAIIYDSDPDNDERWVDMILDGSDFDVKIPTLFLLGRDGYGCDSLPFGVP